MSRKREHGIAMITTLLVMLMVSALLVGFTAAVMTDQRFRGFDRNHMQAFYAAHAGLEKLTADLGNFFSTNYAPTAAQIQALTTTPPSLTGITFQAPGGGPGYNVTFPPDARGNPLATPLTISSGPYQGLTGLLTPYTIDVTAKTALGGEVHLTRTMETVAIPVFQFGMFSDTDLSFFPGANFSFGGRVHTNGNLFLASAGVLTISDRVTAVKDIVRQDLSNAATIGQGPNTHSAEVSMITAPGAFRDLQPAEGSLQGFLGSPPTANWTTISLTTYNGYLRNGTTGAHALNLPVLTAGGSNPDIVRRPAALNENVANPTLFGERYFSKASVRILLSDTLADFNALPTVTATPPVSLEPAAWPPVGYNALALPPIAASPAPWTQNTTANIGANTTTIPVNTATLPGLLLAGTTVWLGSNPPTEVSCSGRLPASLTGCQAVPPIGGGGLPQVLGAVTVSNASLTPAVAGVPVGTIGGFLKVEMQDNNNLWRDVTLEWLNYGMASPNLNPAANGNAGCALGVGGALGAQDPTPNAIIRLQRVADQNSNLPLLYNSCGTLIVGGTPSLQAIDYWPQTLFDTREALVRDNQPANGPNDPTNGSPIIGGVMHYVELDVRNLSRWLNGAGAYAAGTGVNALNNGGTGFAVYFSDRRNNRNALSQETGEYGFEDNVNPADANGIPNATLDAGEDVNASGVLDVYGENPAYNGAFNALPPGGLAPFNNTNSVRPWNTVLLPLQAQVNRAVLFRRALKLVNGGLGNIVAPGLAIIAENPVYLQGDWNANQATGFGNPHVATSIIADAVTLLGNEWNDDNSYWNPYQQGNRTRATNPFYRVAIIAGKNMSFALPAWQNNTSDFGTDGGVHNFLRYLESGGTVNYSGSLASFYYSRQATGIYKCCNTVYNAPTRAYQFDTDFLVPALLPPLTPVFRDLDTLGFSQEIRPGK